MTRAAAAAIRLTKLLLKQPSSVTAMCQSLRENGYARVLVDRDDWWRCIGGGLDEASELTGFRFPPPIHVDEASKKKVDEETEELPVEIQYSYAARLCFRSLFDVATVTFAALTSGSKDLPDPLLEAIRTVERAQEANGSSKSLLFGPNYDSHQPFMHPASDPFGQTFFNLFNYSNGMLNVHKDRGLVTVIASRGSSDAMDVRMEDQEEERQDDQCQSALWVRSPKDAVWRNLDAEVGEEEEVAILLGEDGESLPFARDLGLLAAEHAVRVDPEGGYVSHSHFRPDPNECPGRSDGRGRVSAAMILRHEF